MNSESIMKRDLYSAVINRIIAELERGAALDQTMVRGGRHEYAMQCRN
jgi:hypothetical protein